jgi:hypothetical protein
MPQNPQENAELVYNAVLGQQIESFIKSDIGKYLQARAKKVYNTAVEDFKRLNPADIEMVRKCQTEMWKAEAFMGWLEQGIQEGLNSLGILEGLDDETGTL